MSRNFLHAPQPMSSVSVVVRNFVTGALKLVVWCGTAGALLLWTFGMPLGRHPEQSLYALSVLYFPALSPTLVCSDPGGMIKKILLAADKEPFTTNELFLACEFWGMLLGVLLAQLIVPLDWGMGIQRYPIPIVIGVGLGLNLGCLAGFSLCCAAALAGRRDGRMSGAQAREVSPPPVRSSLPRSCKNKLKDKKNY